MKALLWVLRFGRGSRRGLLAAVALGSLASGAAVGLTAVSAWLIARASQQPPVLHLMVAIVAVRAFGLSRGVLRYLERLASHRTSFTILGDLRAAVVARLERLLPDRSDGPGSLSTGDLLARFVGDVDALQDLWARVAVPAASAVVVGGATVVLSSALSPPAGIALALSLVAAAVVAPLLSQAAARGAGRRLAPLRGRYETELLDVLDGAVELAVYGGLEARLDRLAELDRALARGEARMSVTGGFGTAVSVLAAGAATIAGLAFGAAAVVAGTLSPVNVGVLALAPVALHEIVAGLSAAAHRLPALAAAATRVREVFERPASVTDPQIPEPVPTGPLGFRVRGLTATWVPGGRAVLDGVDLDLPAGSRTMVVGESGSGKSTLAAVLLRFLDPAAGRVELVAEDGTGVDVRAASAGDVRAAVAWCAQDAHLFDSTIEANLRVARPDAAEAELRRVLERARLAGWVDSLPDGLATPVGEHGRSLSGGQRQRIALARALLADKPIVVFDEPTEHLDEPTARALATDLLAATEGRTVLVLTHRPELFPNVERVVRLADGGALPAATAALAGGEPATPAAGGHPVLVGAGAGGADGRP